MAATEGALDGKKGILVGRAERIGGRVLIGKEEVQNVASSKVM